MLASTASRVYATMLQLCRSLSGAVMQSRKAITSKHMGFNCAAPFRERLSFNRKPPRW